MTSSNPQSTSYWDHAFMWVGIVVAVAAGLAAIIFFITQANMQHADEKTQRIESCVESGGTWLDYGEDCIQQHLKENEK